MMKRNRLRRALVRAAGKRAIPRIMVRTPMANAFAPPPAQVWPGHRKFLGRAVLRPIFFRSALRGERR